MIMIEVKKFENPDISVIVPIYKGKKYILTVLENISGQTKDKVEIIFVNDGSPDDSWEEIKRVCGEVERSNISVNIRAISIENGGVGNARNQGIKVACGKYLAIMDQDDRMETDYLETLYTEIERTGNDIVYSGYQEVYPNGTAKRIVRLGEDRENQFICTAGWAKIFNTEFIVKNNIHFAPVPVGEDIYFTVQAFSKTDKISYLDYVGYNWLVNETSLSRSQQTKLSDRMNVLPLLNELGAMDTFDKWKKDEVYEYLMIKTVEFYILSSVSATPVKAVLDYRNDLFAWLEKNFPEFRKNSIVRWGRPNGEQVNVRRVVWIYTWLYRLHLDKFFLRCLSLVTYRK